MVDHLIAFATAHYLLAGAFVILLALLIAHEMSRGGRSLSTSELTALVNKDEAVVVVAFTVSEAIENYQDQRFRRSSHRSSRGANKGRQLKREWQFKAKFPLRHRFTGVGPP